MRVPELDGVRGIAAAGVVLFHVWPASLFWYWAAMDLFFVLSAYLIGSQLVKVGVNRNSVVKYFRRRVERIWPPYMLITGGLLLIALLLWLRGISQLNDPALFWRYATFTQYLEMYWQPYDSIPYWPFAVHLWSLAVEEQFYIVLPLLVWALLRLGRAGRPFVLLAMVAVGIYCRASWVHFYSVFHHLDAFAFGLALALSSRHIARSREQLAGWLRAGLLVSLAVLLPYLVEGYWRLGHGLDKRYWAGAYYAVNALAFGVLWFCMFASIIANQGAFRLRVLRSAWAVHLGRISYCLYLLHFPIFWLAHKAVASISSAMDWSEPRKIWVSLACLPLVFGLAHLMYRGLDQKLQEGRPVLSRRPTSLSVGVKESA